MEHPSGKPPGKVMATQFCLSSEAADSMVAEISSKGVAALELVTLCDVSMLYESENGIVLYPSACISVWEGV